MQLKEVTVGWERADTEAKISLQARAKSGENGSEAHWLNTQNDSQLNKCTFRVVILDWLPCVGATLQTTLLYSD